MMDQAQIQDKIPHRPPMLLVDEVVSLETSRIVGRKTFRADEFFFQGHYPDSPLVPGVILCEFAMQCGAILLAGQVDAGAQKVPVATRLNETKFRKMVRPGDTVDMEVELEERLADAFFMSAKGTHNGQTVLRTRFACTLAPSPSDAAP